MKTLLRTILLAALVAVSYLAGFWHSRDFNQGGLRPGAKTILYYHCPMHPGFKSDKPGSAPCCGMQLEPVYAEPVDSGVENTAKELPAGLVRINSLKQQLTGLRVSTVHKVSGARTLRILGRIAADENRVYPIVAGMSGRVLRIDCGTTGCEVQQDQVLAVFFSRDSLQAQSAYVNARNYVERAKQGNAGAAEQGGTPLAQLAGSEENLRLLGMSDSQLREIVQNNKPTQEIAIRAPTRGFLLSRNIFPGLRFERGTELFRIADLSRVWIVADVFRAESRYIRPGLSARITTSEDGRTYTARVADVSPLFDPSSRTLKVRLEADNPGFSLRPDMFVDVELPVQLQPTLAVPSEAVLDTGLKKSVFVDRGNGFFEPRQVETGWRFGDRVEITKGLTEGEQIVVSGNFLIDSESRLQATASGLRNTPTPDRAGSKIESAAKSLDVVCGMRIDVGKTTLRSDYQGKTFYFCSEKCKHKFDINPRLLLEDVAAPDQGKSASARSGK